MAQWDDAEHPNDPSNPDAPKKKTGPVTDPHDPRLADPTYASDPEVIAYINGIYGAQGTALTQPPGSPGWDPQQQSWNAAPPSTGGAGGPGGASSSIYDAPLTRMFDGTFTPPTPTAMPGVPTFTPPGYTKPDPFKFHAPTPEEALNDPGYQFRTEEGERALQNWAAAKGTLNDSSTAKGLQDYGQGAATQEYANVWNRNWQSQTGEYDKNYQTQYVDPYQIAYRGAADAFAPQLVGYQTNAAATQHGNDMNYLNSWNEFLNKQNYFTNWQDRTFNKQYQVATA